MFTVDVGWTRPARPFPFTSGGGITSNVTSGGTESGALPIFDCDGREVEKVRRDGCANWKAGRRKEGSVIQLGDELRAALVQRWLVGPSIVAV